MGVALSAPEKLQAIPGPWPEWILELQKKYVTEQHTLAEKIDWDVTRAKPFQALTAFVMLAYEPIRLSQPTYPSMTKFLERSDPVSSRLTNMLGFATDIWLARSALQAQGRDGAVAFCEYRDQLLYRGLQDGHRACSSCR